MKERRHALIGLKKHKGVVLHAAAPEGVLQHRLFQSHGSEKGGKNIQHMDSLVEKNAAAGGFLVVSPALAIILAAGLAVSPFHVKNPSHPALTNEGEAG